MKKIEILKKINPLLLNGIAHRGYFNERFTENGLNAFKNALDNNLAIELDVHLTKDKKLIVCHDENLLRTTGKNGIIENLTAQEISKNYRLFDGGIVPLFKDVLLLVQEKVPIVVELKVFRDNYKELTKAVMDELSCIKDKMNIMLISFDPRALFPFRSSGYLRSLLVSHKHKWVYIFRHYFESVDLDWQLFTNKSICNYYHRHLVNCWTIQSVEQLNKVIPYVDMITLQLIDKDIVKDALQKKYCSGNYKE